MATLELKNSHPVLHALFFNLEKDHGSPGLIPEFFGKLLPKFYQKAKPPSLFTKGVKKQKSRPGDLKYHFYMKTTG